MTTAFKFSEVFIASSTKVVMRMKQDGTGATVCLAHGNCSIIDSCLLIIISIAETIMVNQKEYFFKKSELELSLEDQVRCRGGWGSKVREGISYRERYHMSTSLEAAGRMLQVMIRAGRRQLAWVGEFSRAVMTH
jgi:hypothetical protein